MSAPPGDPAIPTEPAPGEAPAAFVARIAGAAERLGTPCGDGELAWHVWDGAGPTVLLLHGGSGSWTHWIRNVGHWAGRFRLVAADLPGLGDSAPPPRPFDPADLTGSVAMMADVVAQGLDTVLAPGEACHLVGFSLGSIVGGHVAAADERRLRSLTLVGTSALGLPWDGLTRDLETMTPEMTPAERLEVQRHNLGIIMLGDTAAADDLAAHLQLANVERARIRTHWLAESDVLARALPRVAVPVAAIWGRDDVYARPGVATAAGAIRHHHPLARVDVVEGAGHWVMYEGAAAFNALLPEVLADLASRSVDAA